MRRMFAQLLAVLGLLLPGAAFGQDVPLETGHVVQREIKGGATHTYPLHLDRDQYIHVIADQDDIDVSMTLRAPDGKTLVDVNRLAEGPEDLFWIAAEAGNYAVAIQAEKAVESGHYRIALESRLVPAAEDRNRFTAFRTTVVEANALMAQGTADSLNKAATKYEEALALWREVKDLRWNGYTAHQLGALYEQLSQLPRARDLLLEALSMRRTTSERRGISSTLNSLGYVYYRLGDSRLALQHYAEAIDLRRELHDRRGEAISLNNEGLAYERLGEREKALEAYQGSLKIRREVGDTRGEAVTLSNLAITYRYMGDLQKSLDLLVESLPLRRSSGDRRGEGSTLNGIAQAYSQLGDYRKAEEYWIQAEKIFEETGEINGRASVLEGLGRVSQSLNNYRDSQNYYERSLVLRRQSGSKQGELNGLVGLCYTFQNLSDFSKARDNAEHALTLATEIEDRFGISEAHSCLGESLYRLGDLTNALEHLQAAATLTRTIGNDSALGVALALMAMVEADMGRLPEALSRVQEALILKEATRAGVANPDLRASYRSLQADLYAVETDVLMRMHAANPQGGFAARALDANEHWRARSLIEMVAESGTDLRQELTDAQRKREDGIVTRITSIQRELFRTDVSTARKKELQQQLAAAERDLDLYQVELRSAGSRYAAVHYPPPLQTDRLRTELLGPNAALIEYALGEKRSYAWVLTPEGLSSATLPGRQEIEREVSAYRKELSERVSSLTVGQSLARLNSQSRQLYRTLLWPFERTLSTSHSLIVVTDGILAYLPFETLMNVDQSPLIEHFSVSYAPSGTTLAVLKSRKDQQRPFKTLLAFADPKVVTTGKAELNSAAERGLDLTPLPNSRSEVTAIGSLYKAGQTRIYMGAEATEQTVKAEDLSGYRFLHFATHGYFDEERPSRSGIVLVPGPDNSQDGILQVGEIMHLHLNADLVTLSACQTGLGQVLAGEGVMGMTRAFLYAGAQSVVVSLWNVNDAATAQLMKAFYRELSRGVSREEALRKAKLSMMHPKTSGDTLISGLLSS